MRKYFFISNDGRKGPFTKNELSKRKILPSTLIWYYGLENWTQAKEIEELDNIIATDSLLDGSVNFHDREEKVSQQGNSYKKGSKNNKWVLLIVAFIVFILIGFSLLTNKNDLDSELRNKIAKESFETNEDLTIYIDLFYRDLAYYGVYPQRPRHQTVKFANLDEIEGITHYHGVSFGIHDDERIEIYINERSWKKFDRAMKHFVIYHELAHDVLNLEHTDKTSENYGKLMYPEVSMYEGIDMDGFIESSQGTFEEYSSKSN